LVKPRNDSFFDEVGLAVDLDQRAGRAVHGGSHHALGGDARRRLAGLVAQLDAQDLFGAFAVAVGFSERLLALHHRCVGLGAQFGNHAGGDCRHCS
jgi:hypothetical protein